MDTARSLYRSTLVSAALAIGCVGVTAAVQAHDHGWRDHDQDRGWSGRGERDWHERGWYRGYGPKWRGTGRNGDGTRAWRTGSPEVTLLATLPPYSGSGRGTDPSVMVRAAL